MNDYGQEQANADAPTVAPSTLAGASFMNTPAQPNDNDLPENLSDQNLVQEPEVQKPKQNNTEEKKNRISQKSWQENKEGSQKFQALTEALSDILNLKDDDSKNVSPDDIVTTLTQKIARQEAQTERFKWERSNLPKELSEEIQQQWDDVCEAKLEADHKYNRLSYDEVWKLVMPAESQQVRQAREKVQTQQVRAFEGSVPISGGGVPKFSNLSDMEYQVGKLAGLTAADYKNAGVAM